MEKDVKRRKPKGMRPDKRIQVTLTIGIREDGSPLKKSFYGKTRTEANEKRDEYKRRQSLGIASEKDMTVARWVDTCLDLYRQNVNAHYRKEDSVPYERLKKEIGRIRVSDVREADLQKLLNAFAESKSYSSTSKYYHAIRLVFSKARRNKMIIDDPSEGLTMPRCEKGTHRALDRAEIDCILTNWDKHRCGIWAMLMLLGGLRRGEMIALDWRNVDMDKRIIHIREVAVMDSNRSYIEERAKTEAGVRTIPMSAPLWECLNSLNYRSGLVCVSASGKQITKSAFKRGWTGYNLAMERILNGEPAEQQGRRVDIEKRRRTYSALGRQYITFSVQAHDLRHTFATALYDAGVDVKSAQYYLGHSDIRMTMDLYTHISKEREKEQREKLVSFLDGWTKKDV